MSRRAAATAYLVIQGGACIIWWVLLGALEGFRAQFELLDDPRVLDSFRVTDLVLIAVASWVAAWLIHRRSPWALPATTLVLGSMAYATGLVIALSAETSWSGVGPAAMVVGCLGTLSSVVLLANDERTLSREPS